MSEWLTAEQLTDILNYLLGRGQRGQMYFPRVSVVVVQSWAAKSERRPVESWCEAILELAGMIPCRPPEQPQRRLNLVKRPMEVERLLHNWKGGV